FTPDDATNLAKAVRTYPKTTDYDLAELLTQLGIGEAVVTVLSDRGTPTPVAWTRLRPPRSLMAQLDPAVQQQAIANSSLQAKYGTAVDRESAYEKLAAKLAPPAQPAPAEPQQQPPAEQHHAERQQHAEGGAAAVVTGVLASSAFKSFTRSAASVFGREISRSLFGTAKRRR
ncbi:MAG TPA: helicase HerA-like domain-containing protein, partial [Jatrophihabitans sp.]|nr:helicase HerA-like domain-containing protein [Jatrophihabitans sp.]